jgi:hypothetical protein
VPFGLGGVCVPFWTGGGLRPHQAEPPPLVSLFGITTYKRLKAPSETA